MPPRRQPARARILDVADRLFYQQGIRVVGVEAIVAEADTAKTTLYFHFGSKDALVVAYLHGRAALARERIEQGLASRGGAAHVRILHLYDLLADELAAPGYRGSPFINACVELGPGHPATVVARGHRQWLLDTFTSLAAETGAPDLDALAAQLLQLYEAATVATQIGGDGGAARTARSAAVALTTRPSAPRAAADDDGLPEPPQPTGVAGRQAAERPAARGRPQPQPTNPAEPTRPTTPAGRAQPTTPARLVGGGSPDAHHLVAFLNSAHLPDSDDQLTDNRAGPWLAEWLADACGSTPAGLDTLVGAPAELLSLREGLRQLAAVNCGAEADPEAVAEAAAVLNQAPLVVDLASGGEPRLATSDDGDATQLAIAVAAGAYLAVRARGEWPRLKVCASPDCRWAFLDTTRNRSRRWCDMAGCGNRAKNRTWRDRHNTMTGKMV